VQINATEMVLSSREKLAYNLALILLSLTMNLSLGEASVLSHVRSYPPSWPSPSGPDHLSTRTRFEDWSQSKQLPLLESVNGYDGYQQRADPGMNAGVHKAERLNDVIAASARNGTAIKDFFQQLIGQGTQSLWLKTGTEAICLICFLFRVN
jgi:phage-related protein